MKGFRKQRVGELLLSFLAQEIRHLGDPRLQYVTLTDIDLSPDLKNAAIYWTSLKQGDGGPGTEFLSSGDREEIMRSFQGITKILKKRIGEELQFRYTPELHFRFDDSAERGSRIEALLHQIRK